MFGMLGKKIKGFSLVEIVFVVAIIGLLLAVALPNFRTARENVHRDICINNLRQIELAKEQWSIENDKDTDDPAPTAEDLDSYIKEDIWDEDGDSYKTGHDLVCPLDTASIPTIATSYTINAIGTDAECKIYPPPAGDHEL